MQVPPRTSRPWRGEELSPAEEPGLSFPWGTTQILVPPGLWGQGWGGAAVGWGRRCQNPFVGLLEVSALFLSLPGPGVPVQPPSLPSCSADDSSSLKINRSIFNCSLNNCFIFI